jgi:hypothetical protein
MDARRIALLSAVYVAVVEVPASSLSLLRSPSRLEGGGKYASLPRQSCELSLSSLLTRLA